MQTAGRVSHHHRPAEEIHTAEGSNAYRMSHPHPAVMSSSAAGGSATGDSNITLAPREPAAAAGAIKKGKEDFASLLPDELLHRVLLYLDIDSAVHCGVLAHRWRFIVDEKVYKELCERTYLDQSEVKAVNPRRFGGSFKRMLMERPRVRTNGLYSLMKSYIKKPQKDMWSEIAPGTILEVKFWRYLRFLPGGRLLYAMTYSSPNETVRLFKEGRHKDLCAGQYTVGKGGILHCRVQTHYSIIYFRLELQSGMRGRWNQLHLMEHTSVPFTDPTGTPIAHRVSYDVFHFHRAGML